MTAIPFNKPYFSGNELTYIKEAISAARISGDGIFTIRCHQFIEHRYGFKKVLLTTSCTDALEMAAILCDIAPGDEVIAPSYTFVSTVNAFVMRGARIRFADSEAGHPNMDLDQVEPLINARTKAIVCVHYAGVACDMDRLQALCNKYSLLLVEDAAQAIESTYKGQPLGGFGHLAAFSFHETKNIISGEGGMLVINDERFMKRAEIIREKGTNRSSFFRGEVDRYGWVDIGSSFLPSDMIAAYLYAQLENIDDIQARRKMLWYLYDEILRPLALKGLVKLPVLPGYASNNAQSYYLVCETPRQRDALIRHLEAEEIHAVFHYLSLHKSPYFKMVAEKEGFEPSQLPNSDMFSDCLVRLPLFYELDHEALQRITRSITLFFEKQ